MEKFSADVTVGLELTPGQKQGSPLWLKQQNPFLWDWMCYRGQCRGVWHAEIMAINTEPAWHDRVIVGMRVGYF